VPRHTVLVMALAAAAEGLARVQLDNPVQQVHGAMWQPAYPRIEASEGLAVSPPGC
jgi:malate dehydrogenase (oxaloacetate-decarboxylating)